MIDINLLLTERGGNPELVRQSQVKRGANPEDVDKVIELFGKWTKAQKDLDNTNRDANAIQKEIGKKMKAKEDASELVVKKKALEKSKGEFKKLAEETHAQWTSILSEIGNIVDPEVPVSLTEDDNKLIRTNPPDGDAPEKRSDFISHHEVLYRIGGYDQKRGADVAGHRGYFLTGPGVDFNLALVSYGLSFLSKRGYTKLQTPFFMRKSVMAKTAQLAQFDEELYGVVGDGEDKYLIATSEQPISAFHMGEKFDQPEKQLPIKYAGYSTCFRKEAGAHGRDTRGIFRVHQFEKIEQFVLTQPEKSNEMFDEMIGAAEEFYQSLGIPYRVVAIVSGALNNAAAKKFDLEAWFPHQGEYKELVSCSNCTDYQSRNLNIQCGAKKVEDRKSPFVHLLNCTLCATERALCCVLENYQTPDGVVVPDVLQPFMGGVKFFPYIKSDEEAKRAHK
ncbi:Cytosolic seryl-tRNA synthetase [Mycoemilia scoparia]|uniref:serine--tRNA ligase n=1 Tax=Mycoemilia scoparia TaxID=417184 RepID=A0A9W7ZWA7_9FUNG|nr:Cytosolic seryl-tRNA synthetase [Mycoemilia scoparia]KAJ1918719.1 Cytosolic seryl-tRNA synthetase [Mycoemilia scoparia]